MFFFLSLNYLLLLCAVKQPPCSTTALAAFRIGGGVCVFMYLHAHTEQRERVRKLL